MKLIKLLSDIIFMTRPILFIPVWAFSLLGYYKYEYSSVGAFKFFLISEELFIILGKIMVFTLSVGAVNIFNQVADVEADEANDGFSVFSRSGLSALNANIIAFLIAMLSILIPYFFKWNNIYLFSIGAVITGLVYSFKPTYFTGRPFLDFLTNAFGFGVIAFAVGWILAGGGFENFWLSSLPYILLMCAGSISSTLPDIKGDKIGGKSTTAVVLGEFNAHILATLFIAFTVLFSWIVKDHIALAASGFSLPVYLLFIIKRIDVFKEATYKIGGAMLMLIVALVYPIFIPFSIVLFIGTIVYFRIRFQVSYPSLLPIREY